MTALRRHNRTFSKSQTSSVFSAGFTLIELLVSVGVIAALLGLLAPAVQSARETARRVQCRNNLKQLAAGIHAHESTFQRLPGNGWGYLWVGEPDRGSAHEQPGGWIYQVLPYIEQTSLRQLGAATDPATRANRLGDLTERHLPLLRCPTRAASNLAPRNPSLVWFNAETRPNNSRTDYAINEGDYVTDTDGGPGSLSAGDSSSYPWIDVSAATGVGFLRSTVRIADITDGTTNTYLIGEKYVMSNHYQDGGDPGYDQHPFGGVDLDINRWTVTVPHCDGSLPLLRSFGSAHPTGFQISFCDGSVRALAYNIDAVVHRRLGNRYDGSPHGNTD